jgi:hypothetical protein
MRDIMLTACIMVMMMIGAMMGSMRREGEKAIRRDCCTTTMAFVKMRYINCKEKSPIYVYSQKRICSASQSKFPHSCICERFIYSHDWSTYTVKKVHEFPISRGMSLTKFPLGRFSYDVIIPAQGEFGSDIPAGDGKVASLFLRCIFLQQNRQTDRGNIHVYKSLT